MKHSKFVLPQIAVFAACVAFGALRAAAAELVVIDLHNRTAEELLPALRPMVGPEVALSAIDYKLLVRGNADDVARIRDVVAILDRAPKQLLISVRYTDSPQVKSGTVGAAVTGTTQDPQVAVRGNVTTRTASDSSVGSVRVLEGNSAHISAGVSVPIVTAYLPTLTTGRHVGPGAGTGVGVGVATEYRDISSGFDVLPRISGDRVVLEISAQQQRLLDSNSGTAAFQSATTTVAGRLGEWIDLGGVTSSMDESRTTIGVTGGSHRVSTQSDQRSIAVKVEQAQ